MATNLSITAANVSGGGPSTATKPGLVGEAVTHAQPLFFDSSTNKYMVGDADVSASDSSAAEIVALAITAGSGDGAYPIICTRGPVVIGATLVQGATYYLSPDKGGICREDQLTAGCWVTQIGTALTTAILDFLPQPKRVKVPA